MNGLCEIRVQGKVYPLQYGMVAIEYIDKHIFNTEGNATMGVHMIYAGMLNYAFANEKPAPSFKEVYDLCELFDEEKDNKEQGAKVSKCFNESRHGAKWVQAVKKANKELKKKIQLIGTLSEASASENLD